MSVDKVLSPGDVYKKGKMGLKRILMADSIYYLYEAADFRGWDKTSYLNVHLSFYGEGVKFFWANDPVYLGNEPFTQEQIDILRPDLPLSLSRTKIYDWKDITSLSSSELETTYGSLITNSFNCKKLYLYPKGPKWGRLKQVEITADNKESITYAELINKAASIQSNLNGNLTGGTGLFRVGVFKKCPTFAIDDYYFGDVSTYRQEEEGFDWVSYLAEQKKRKPFFSYEKVNDDGEYRVNFDLNQVTLGADDFAVKSIYKEKIVIQFTVEKAQHTFNLNGFQPATYYLGFLNTEGKFTTHQSMFYGY